MFESVTVIGAGRAGSAIAARLRERGVERAARTAISSSSACPTARSREVAPRDRARAPGSRTSAGATPLAALAPHARRFSVHPLQTLRRGRGPGAARRRVGAPSPARRDEARARATGLAETLGLRPFDLADDRRALYHAGAVIASNYLVTLHRAAATLFEEAGAPPEALVPLMRRTIENGFELTGPIARGDWATVERASRGAPRRAARARAAVRALAEATRT